MGNPSLPGFQRRIEHDALSREVLRVPGMKVSGVPRHTRDEIPVNVVQVGDKAVWCEFISDPGVRAHVRVQECSCADTCHGECSLLKH